MRRFPILLFTLSALFSACEKFEEGGSVKKADEKILGYWRLNGYFKNGENATSTVSIRNFTETFSAGGGYLRSYTQSDTINHEETGNWQMSADNLLINISGVDSLRNFSEADITLPISSYTIIRLAKDELWYEFEEGGNTHHFRLITN